MFPAAVSLLLVAGGVHRGPRQPGPADLGLDSGPPRARGPRRGGRSARLVRVQRIAGVHDVVLEKLIN